MKKTYSKPQIAVENYYLSETISAGCSNTVSFTTISNCQNNFDPAVEADFNQQTMIGLFASTSGLNACFAVPTDDSKFTATCYFTSTGNNVFAS